LLNELIDFGWKPSAKPTFALSRELLFQSDHHFGGRPVSQRLPPDCRHFHGERRFFQRVVWLRAGRHRLRCLKRINRSRVLAAVSHARSVAMVTM
jgi:hypothetical protein